MARFAIATAFLLVVLIAVTFAAPAAEEQKVESKNGRDLETAAGSLYGGFGGIGHGFGLGYGGLGFGGLGYGGLGYGGLGYGGGLGKSLLLYNIWHGYKCKISA